MFKRPLKWLAVLSLISFSAFAKERVALVIGNADYKATNIPALSNTLNDANDMASALKELDFEVITLINGTKKQILLSVNEFTKKLQDSEVGLFYFSGHGIQKDGHNYLIPLETNITSAADLEFEAVDMMRVLKNIRDAGNGLNIIILDACRDNPFKGIFGSKGYSNAKGLAETGSISGSIIAYAAQPGNPAFEDKTHRNSYYTKHLLKFIEQKGLSLTELFSRVSWAVAEDTDGKQEPWTSFLSLPPFCLAGCQAATVDETAQENDTNDTTVEITELLKTCQFRFDNNWLTSGDNGTALECYKSVLMLDPNNLDASRGLVNIENRYVEWAEKALNQGKESKTRQYLASLRKVNPESPKLAALEDNLRTYSKTGDNSIVILSKTKEKNFSEITISEMEEVLFGFIDAWNKKQYHKQISYLSTDFYYIDQKGEKVYYYDYINNKKGLFKKYEWISVKVSDIKYSVNENIGVVTYYQHYDSPMYESKGLNKFYLRKESDQVKIFKEIFDRDWYKIK